MVGYVDAAGTIRHVQRVVRTKKCQPIQAQPASAMIRPKTRRVAVRSSATPVGNRPRDTSAPIHADAIATAITIQPVMVNDRENVTKPTSTRATSTRRTKRVARGGTAQRFRQAS